MFSVLLATAFLATACIEDRKADWVPVSGTVFLPDGSPAVDRRITAIVDGNVDGEVRTNEVGAFEIRLPGSKELIFAELVVEGAMSLFIHRASLSSMNSYQLPDLTIWDPRFEIRGLDAVWQPVQLPAIHKLRYELAATNAEGEVWYFDDLSASQVTIDPRIMQGLGDAPYVVTPHVDVFAAGPLSYIRPTSQKFVLEEPVPIVVPASRGRDCIQLDPEFGPSPVSDCTVTDGRLAGSPSMEFLDTAIDLEDSPVIEAVSVTNIFDDWGSPVSVEILFSMDLESWRSVGTVEFPSDRSFVLEISERLRARYVRFLIHDDQGEPYDGRWSLSVDEVGVWTEK